MRMATLMLVLLGASCAPKAPTESEAAHDDAPAASAAARANVRSVGPEAASLAYTVAAHSPLLTEAQRRSIAQDFHGAPIDGDFAVHTVTADKVSCRMRTQSVGEGTECAVGYAPNASVSLTGEDAQFLYDALGAAGVEAEAGMSHLERTITDLSCTVDDKIAQTTSSTGDEINGFACRFTVV